jgi:hypothetical protein
MRSAEYGEAFRNWKKVANILTLLRGNRCNLGREFSKNSYRYSHFGFFEKQKPSESIDFIG